MENPIKENRYVHDITFATRLKNFINHVGLTVHKETLAILPSNKYLLEKSQNGF